MSNPRPPAPVSQGSQHRLPQYSGMHATLCDSRPNPRTRRCISAEDDPARAKWVEQVLARYRKEEE
jgi:hypothetical protein